MSCTALLRVVFFALLLWPALYAQEEAPQLDGYVTRVGTAEDFDVNGKHVHCRPKVQPEAAGAGCSKHVFGDGGRGDVSPARVERAIGPAGGIGT